MRLAGLTVEDSGRHGCRRSSQRSTSWPVPSAGRFTSECREISSDACFEHREGLVEGFTSRYGIKRLVWFELHVGFESAITREKQLKKWSRAWKLELVEGANPEWRDLWPELLD